MSARPRRWALETSLREAGYAYAPVAGTSMLPFLWPGTRVRVLACAPDDVCVGDVVVVVRNDCLVIHRAVRREDTAWRTRGDAHLLDDPATPDERVVARCDGQPLGPFVVRDARPLERALGRTIVVAAPILARLLEPVIPVARALRARLRIARRGPSP